MSRFRYHLIFLAILVLGLSVVLVAYYFCSTQEEFEEPDVVIQRTQTSYGSILITSVVHVYDGDTFQVSVDTWPRIVGEKLSVRIYGIDTPEINSTNPKVKFLAIEARDFVRGKLLNARQIELRDIKRDKYFRIDATVFVDGEDLGQSLIVLGLAKQYFGGQKPKWATRDYNIYKEKH